MTAHPIPENGHCWWLVAGKERRLHAIRGHDLGADAMRAAIDEARPVPARAVCGLRRRWWMPGLFSRLGRRRCIPCSLALGIPPGYGTPVNEHDLAHRHPPAHLGDGANAEDCPACRGSDLPYPFICPGPKENSTT